MSRKREAKDIKKMEKDLIEQITVLRKENSNLKIERKTLLEELAMMKEKYISELPHRIKCGDCGLTANITRAEKENVIKIICPGCRGNNWKIMF